MHRELLEMTCRVANALKSDGVKKGDRVAIYMPVTPLLVASMLACARIGAIHRYKINTGIMPYDTAIYLHFSTDHNHLVILRYNTDKGFLLHL